MYLLFQPFTDLFALQVALVILQCLLKLLVVMCMKKPFLSHFFPLVLYEGDILIFWFKTLASIGVTGFSITE